MRKWDGNADGAFALVAPDGCDLMVDTDQSGTFHVVAVAGKEIARARVAMSPDSAAKAAANVAAVSASETKMRNLIDNAKNIRDAIKTGTLTFGSGPRDTAVKQLAKAVLYLARGLAAAIDDET